MATLIERAVSQQRTQSPGLRPVPHQSRDGLTEHVELPLSRGIVTLIDASDFGVVGGVKWSLLIANGGMYARRIIYNNGQRLYSYLHREILGAPAEATVDHINGDGLDNRRANLRLATHSQNHANRRLLASNNTSGYRGVGRAANGSPYWAAQIKVNGIRVHIGHFEKIEDAARAYDFAARLAFGAFAKLNFPTEGGVR